MLDLHVLAGCCILVDEVFLSFRTVQISVNQFSKYYISYAAKDSRILMPKVLSRFISYYR